MLASLLFLFWVLADFQTDLVSICPQIRSQQKQKWTERPTTKITMRRTEQPMAHRHRNKIEALVAIQHSSFRLIDFIR